MRRFAHSFVLSGLLLAPCFAHADTFKVALNSSSLGISTVGTLTGSANGDGSFTVTGITGNGITGLVAPFDPFLGNNDLLFPSNSRLFDVDGLAFTGTFSGLSLSVDIFSTVAGYEALATDTAGNIYDVPATASLVATAVTPEPSGLLLSLTGALFAAAFFVRKRLSPFGIQA